MKHKHRALAMSLMAGAFFSTTPAISDEAHSPPPTTATRPAKTLPNQTSLPNNNAPPATATQTTGQANPDPTVKQMNDEAKRKIETEGK
jgi:hypothetical protein